MFKSETEFTLFSKIGSARFPWFNCIFFVCWQWKAEENSLTKEMKYDQEKQAFSHYMRWIFFSHSIFYKKKSLPFETTALLWWLFGHIYNSPKENVGKKINQFTRVWTMLFLKGNGSSYIERIINDSQKKWDLRQLFK